MKNLNQYLLYFLLFFYGGVSAQTAVITDDPDYTTGQSSSVLDLKSTSKGLLVPRMDSSQRVSISSPAAGLLVYQTDKEKGFYYYSGTAWVNLLNSSSPGQWITSGDSVRYYKGNAANNSTFEADGTMQMNGTATVWDDLRVPVSATNKAGSTPTIGVFIGNTQIYYFMDNATNELFFEVQMHHSWKTGSTIYPHVHWIPYTNGSSEQKVQWSLEYTWVDINGVFSTTTTITGDTPTSNPTSLVAKTHYLTQLGTGISGSGITGVSSMLVCRLFRVGPTDTYTDKAGLLEFDFHYEVNTIGSRQEFIK
ncbi:MAG: hypothetical protein NTU44_05075 [Bacteroidetes bacterium]|nr:hypothetical protein [Bacteroidota bacterium]